ncbi:Mitochondrial transcription factor 1 [Lunasporangiospora selenospora]|uniref:rRNA adenine N(6)-methyltransferase n=1 Tax=Lunasporangiospora selenospora TaxID=979761 RepID=A0A9P6G0B6_9FUNG|nr:Mitochondrial transcription factor 1 [Lunasporangiospora selenospora]
MAQHITRPLLKSLPKLPAPDRWTTLFKGSKARGQLRVNVKTEEVANAAADLMKITPQKNIIELYAGPGQLTRSMALAGANKVVAVENGEYFKSSLQSLVEHSEGRVQHLQEHPVADPFDELLNPSKGYLPKLESQPRDKIHSGLAIVGSIPNSTFGEKHLLDLITASIEQMGPFRLGRIEMFMFVSKETLQKFRTPPGTPQRQRLTLLSEAAVELKELLRPGMHHFHLPYDYHLVHIVPHEKAKIDIPVDVFDYCLRSLFTNKSNQLNKTIKLLGPGADILLGRLSFDTTVKIKHMTLEQLNEVAVKFDQWPLRPAVLYEDMIMHETRSRK